MGLSLIRWTLSYFYYDDAYTIISGTGDISMKKDQVMRKTVFSVLAILLFAGIPVHRVHAQVDSSAVEAEESQADAEAALADAREAKRRAEEARPAIG
jgi:hypothetical protein